ncbi:arabinosyltransferase rra3 [Quercus suber]|uniref:Arabinosyltransferase rra3 n=1 Tax=Quercus suber TaxID=58331 RepID=A0AAW0ME89_QUESU
MADHRDGPLIRDKSKENVQCRITLAIVIGIVLGSVFAFLYPYELFTYYSPFQNQPFGKTNLKLEIASLSEKNAELNIKLKFLGKQLRLAEQGRDYAQKQVTALGGNHKAGPFNTVKGLRTNPTVVPDESVNPRLAKILEEVAVHKEIIVAIANSKVQSMLEVWFTSIKKVGIPNHLVVALDDHLLHLRRDPIQCRRLSRLFKLLRLHNRSRLLVRNDFSFFTARTAALVVRNA